MNKIKKVYGPCLLIQIFIIVLASCGNEKTSDEISQVDDGSVLIPMNKTPINSVNMKDENGLKQGIWQDYDRQEGNEIYSITKEYNYKDDILHGYYLEYKTKSADTLIYGKYYYGKKQGEWRYWAKDKNEIEYVEIYENGVITH